MALTTSGVKRTVFGDLRIVMGAVTLSQTAAVLDVTMSKVVSAIVCSSGAVANNCVAVAINSNDVTVGTEDGSVYVDCEDNATAGTFILIGV